MGLIEVVKAPALVGLRPKSIFNPSAIDYAMRSAGRMSFGIEQTLPVWYGPKNGRRHLVGFVAGEATWEHDGRFRRFWGRTVEELRGRGKGRYQCSDDDLIAAVTASAPRTRRPWYNKAFDGTHVADNWYDLWPVSGSPQGVVPAGTARQCVRYTDATTGGLCHGRDVGGGGYTKRLLSQMVMSTIAGNKFLLHDRVAAYEQCTMTGSNQTMDNTTPPNRYNGNGEGGLKVTCCINAAQNATVANLTTFVYTDQDGNTGTGSTTRTVGHIVSGATPTNAIGARVIAPQDSGATVVWSLTIPLSTSDYGVRQIDNYTWSAAPTGSFYFLCWRALGYEICVPRVGDFVLSDEGSSHEPNPIIKDGACLSYFCHVAGAGVMASMLTVGWA